MANRQRERRELPRHGEERDRWREGGYEGHRREEFRPEADDRYSEQYGGNERSRYGGGASAARDYGDWEHGRERASEPRRPQDAPASGPYRAEAPYTGHSQQGGGYRDASQGGFAGRFADRGAGPGQHDDFDRRSAYGRDFDPRGGYERDVGYGPGRGFDERQMGRGGYSGSLGQADQEWNRGRLAGQGRYGYQGGWPEFGEEPGGHRGRGPRNYTRSDERIREDVCEWLSEDPHLDATGIDVDVQNGEVTLNGTVPERRDKRLAEDLAENVSGVKHVQNNLRASPENS